MNLDIFDKYFESTKKSIEDLSLPIALLDNQLSVVYTNKYLRTNFPYLTAVDSVITLMEGYNISSIIQKLQISSLSTSYPCKIPILSTSLDFSPILDKKEQLIGAIVHLSIFNQDPIALNEESANKMLSSFSNTLRSPLSSIFSAISNMNARLDLGDISACELMLIEINKNSYRLLKGFTSITEYSRYLNGVSFLKLKNIDFRAFLEDILNAARSMLRTAGEDRGVELTFSVPEEPITLSCDPDKLVIVLMSLLSNSATFCDDNKPDGNHIHVSVSVSDGYVKIALTDHGIGIPEEIQAKIFQPYFSYGKDAYLFSSVGLGLPLSRMIVAHHMGTLAVNSLEDVGTTVAFTISRSLQNLQLDSFSSAFTLNSSFSDSSSTYIRNKFSSLFVFLSDICECPEP